VIQVNDLKDNVNDAGTAHIHVVILVIDQKYDIINIVTDNLAKSQVLYRLSGHSPELRYETMIYIIIQVNDLKHDINYTRTDNIHVVILVIDWNYDINNIMTANHENYIVFQVIHLNYDIKY
jgi:hypothetical protein